MASNNKRYHNVFAVDELSEAKSRTLKEELKTDIAFYCNYDCYAFDCGLDCPDTCPILELHKNGRRIQSGYGQRITNNIASKTIAFCGDSTGFDPIFLSRDTPSGLTL